MTALENLLSPQVTERVGWTLIHFVWQATVVALVLAVALRLLRKRSASTRYIVSCLALGLTVAMPMMTIPCIEVEGPSAEVGPTPPAAAAMEVTPVEVVDVADLTAEPFEAIPLDMADGSARVPWTQRAAETLRPALPYLVCGWLLGVFGLSAWHLGGWTQLQRMKRRMVRQVAAPLHAKLALLARRLDVGRAVGLLESALVEVPTVVGWIKPVILLPASVLSGLSPAQLDAILAHELGHIRRYDYLVNIIQTVVEILGFFHPAVWWVSHRVRDERENCCDDLAVQICGDSVGYARALTCLEEMRHDRPELAVAASGGSLVGRIARLLGRPAQTSHRFAWLPGLIALLLVAALLVPTALVLAAPDASPAIERAQASAEDTERDSDEPAAEAMVQATEDQDSQDRERIIVATICVKLNGKKELDRETMELLAEILSSEDQIGPLTPEAGATLSDVLRTWVVGKSLTSTTVENLLEMLQSRGYLEVASRPQVMVYNNSQAVIQIDDSEHFWMSENPNTSPRRVTTGTSYKITPHVPRQARDRVRLEIEARHTALGAPPQADALPTIYTMEMASTITMRWDRYVSFLLEPDDTDQAPVTKDVCRLIMLQPIRANASTKPAATSNAPARERANAERMHEILREELARIEEKIQETQAVGFSGDEAERARQLEKLKQYKSTVEQQYAEITRILDEEAAAPEEGEIEPLPWTAGTPIWPPNSHTALPLPDSWHLEYKSTVSTGRIEEALFNAKVVTSNPQETPAPEEVEFVLYDPNGREVERFTRQSMIPLNKTGHYTLIGRQLDNDSDDDVPPVSYGPFALDLSLTGWYMLSVDLSSGFTGYDASHNPEGARCVYKNLDGRMNQEFGFERLLRSQHDRWTVAKPYLTLYDDDVRCLITADQGIVQISTDDNATASLPEPVAFEGNVKISIVRSEGKSCVLHLEDLAYSVAQGCLSSSGPVRLVYRETELTGTGLELFTMQTPKSVEAIHTVELGTAYLDRTETGSFVGCLRPASQPQSPTSATQVHVARQKEDATTAIRMDFTVLDVAAGATLDRETAARLSGFLTGVDTGDAQVDTRHLRRYHVGPLLEMLHRVTPPASFQMVIDLVVSKGYVDVVTAPTLEALSGQRAQITSPDEMTLSVIAETRDNSSAVRMDINLDLSLREPSTDSTEPNAPVSVRSVRSHVTLEADDQGYALQPLAGFTSSVEDAQIFYLLVHPQIVPLASKSAAAAEPAVDLIDALTEIATRTGTRIAVDQTVKPTPVKATTDGLSVTPALRRVLESTPYAFRELREHTFLVYRPITVSFQGEDLREALHTIGTKAGVRIDCEADVTGEVYADIRDVPLETALDIILAGSPFIVKSNPEGYVIADRDTQSPLSFLQSNATQEAIRVVVRFMQIGTDLRDALQEGLPIKGIASDDDLAALYDIGKRMSQEKWIPLDEAQKQLLLKAIQGNAGSRCLASPAVTVRSGELAEMTLSEEMVYTAGYDEPNTPGAQPKVRSATVRPGLKLAITPSLDSEDRIALSGLVTLSYLEGFDDRTYRDRYFYQVPRLDVHGIPIDDLNVPNGQAALLFDPHLRWPYNPAPDDPACPLLLLFDAAKVEDQIVEPPAPPALPHIPNPAGMGTLPAGVQQLPGGMGGLLPGAEPLPGGMGGR